jgi:hypothetical protein
MAALLFTTLPIVLAFSGLAYTDLPTACMRFAALFAFATWLQKPSLRSTPVAGNRGRSRLSRETDHTVIPALCRRGDITGKWLIERRTGGANWANANWLGPN